jgi:hypothetical protein
MPTIAIRLDPDLLDNPDADLRYLIPDLIVAAGGGFAAGDGYDYDVMGRMILYLAVTDLAAGLSAVEAVLDHQQPLGNHLRPAAIVAVAEPDHCDDPQAYRVVFPAEGTPMFPLT